MSELEIIAIVIAACVLVALTIYAYARIRPRLYAGRVELDVRQGSVEFITPTEGTPYLQKRNSDGSISDEPFKILTCTDTHMRTDESKQTLALLARFLDIEKPDLVILVGDNIVDRVDTELHERLKAFFEARNQFWGFVLGNHDSERLITNEFHERERVGCLTDEDREQITLRFRKQTFDNLTGGEHCIVRDEGVYGSGNCVVNIKNSQGITQSLFFFDSGDYVYGRQRKAIGTEKRCYGYIRREQQQWYERRLSEITAENSGIMPSSIAFFHIPLMEFKKAFKDGFWGIGGAKILYGTNYEKPCASDINGGAFETFSRVGSTKIVVCGHDHKNDSCVLYQGIRLMYSQGIPTDGAYSRRKKARLLKLLNRVSDRFCCFVEGVSLFVVREDGSVDVSARYVEKLDK